MNNLEEKDEMDSGISEIAPSKRDSKANLPPDEAMAAALKKKRGTLASTTSSHHHNHRHHHHHRHSNPRHSNPANHLQLPGLVDNALARDNSSICHRAIEEGPPESVWTKFGICCLRMNTKLAVYLAACIGCTMNGAGLLFYSAQGQFLYGLPSLISVLLYCSVLFAQFRQRADLFLPFLVINGLILFLWACLCLYLLGLLILLPDWCVQLITGYYEWEEIGEIIGTPAGSDRIRYKVRLFIAISFCLTLIYLAIECWLWWIIFRGFKAAKDQKAEEWLQNLNKNIRSISIY